MKMRGRKKVEKEYVHERLQRIYSFMTNFYGEEMINEIMIFYQNLRSINVVDNSSDENVDME
jgi:hypothetical protein